MHPTQNFCREKQTCSPDSGQSEQFCNPPAFRCKRRSSEIYAVCGVLGSFIKVWAIRPDLALDSALQPRIAGTFTGVQFCFNLFQNCGSMRASCLIVFAFMTKKKCLEKYILYLKNYKCLLLSSYFRELFHSFK